METEDPNPPFIWEEFIGEGDHVVSQVSYFIHEVSFLESLMDVLNPNDSFWLSVADTDLRLGENAPFNSSLYDVTIII